MDSLEQQCWLDAYIRLPDLLEIACSVVSWDGEHLAPCRNMASWAFTTDILVCGYHYQQALVNVGCPVLFCECCGNVCPIEQAVQGVCSECRKDELLT